MSNKIIERRMKELIADTGGELSMRRYYHIVSREYWINEVHNAETVDDLKLLLLKLIDSVRFSPGRYGE